METLGVRVDPAIKKELHFIAQEMAIPVADLARTAIVGLVDEARERLGSAEFDRDMRNRRRHANTSV